MDIQNSVNDIWYRLGFLNLAELNSTTQTPWVTPSELFIWADEAAKRLAYEAGLFVTADASVPVTAFNGVYALPETHVFTLLAAILTATGGTAGTGEEWGTLPWGTVPWGGGTPFVEATTLIYSLLRLTSVRDLWALDGTWSSTTGTPKRASLDAGSVGTLTLYPIPLVDAILFQVCQEFPDVSPTATLLNLPTVLQDYFSYAMLAGARGKESELADLAMADHYKQRMDLYDQIMGHLYGSGQ